VFTITTIGGLSPEPVRQDPRVKCACGPPIERGERRSAGDGERTRDSRDAKATFRESSAEHSSVEPGPRGDSEAGSHGGLPNAHFESAAQVRIRARRDAIRFPSVKWLTASALWIGWEAGIRTPITWSRERRMGCGPSRSALVCSSLRRHRFSEFGSVLFCSLPKCLIQSQIQVPARARPAAATVRALPRAGAAALPRDFPRGRQRAGNSLPLRIRRPRSSRRRQ